MKRPIPLLLLLLLALLPRAGAAQLPSRHTLWWEGAGAGALLAGSLLADRALQGEIFLESDHEQTWLARSISALAEPRGALPLLALAYGVGRFDHRPAMLRAASRGAAAFGLAAAGAGVLKVLVGRERPDAGGDPDELFPFSLAGRHESFPSGHTAAAFALAATAAHEIHSPLAAPLAYGAAGAVAWSRLYRNVHWSSDVVAGALVGIGSAQLARRLLPRPLEGRRVSLAAAPGYLGLRIALP